jgi:hypothetical protein
MSKTKKVRRTRTEGTAKPKREMTVRQCDDAYRALTKGKYPELEAQRQFDRALTDAQEAQRLRLTGVKPVEGATLDDKMHNAQRAQHKRLNGVTP